jgi:hypothetical protein
MSLLVVAHAVLSCTTKAEANDLMGLEGFIHLFYQKFVNTRILTDAE